ncbi:hypothetical protein A0J61_06690, partial [Choanephora cucurbitarum]
GYQPENILLVFLPANTTSKLQPLDAGTIANFKAMFREKQYERANNLFISNHLNNSSVYKLKEVQALFMLAEAWLRVKPMTINNCWVHTKVLLNTAEIVSDPPTTSLPLEDDVVDRINELLPQLPGIDAEDGLDLAGFDLDSGENHMIITETFEVIEDQEEEEETVDVEENRRRLREALETVLAFEFSLDEFDQMVHRRLGQKLQAIRAEEINWCSLVQLILVSPAFQGITVPSLYPIKQLFFSPLILSSRLQEAPLIRLLVYVDNYEILLSSLSE